MNRWLTPGLLLATLVALFFACLIGTTPLPVASVLAALFGQGTTGDAIVVWEIRLPRALAAMIVGVALGTSGAALQGLLRNPLADPGVLGVSASAALGATFVLYWGLVTVTAFAVPLAAIAGALIATLVIGLAAARTSSVLTLILVGVGLSSFATAAMTLLMNLAPNPFSLSDMINWMLGTVANRSLDDLVLAGPFIAIGLALLAWTRSGLAVLTLGEEAAAGAGVDLNRLRLLVILGTGLASGGAVAIAGVIGFVGIVAPHVIRPLTGHDPARSLLPSALLAGLLLILADVAVRIAPTTNELKLGVVAALLGAPAFVWIAVRRRAVHD